MNKNIQAILNMLDSNTFQRGVLLDILESYGEDIALIPIKLFVHQKILRTRKKKMVSLGIFMSSHIHRKSMLVQTGHQ